MADVHADRYEAPQIEQRTPIGPMLIGIQVISANVDGNSDS